MELKSRIHEGWQALTVFDIADRKKARFDDGDWVEAEHITDKGIRLIQTGNIGVGSYIEKVAKKYIYDNSFDLLKCKPLEIGDLLICRLAEPAGRACILPNISEEKVITSVDVTIFRPDTERFDRGYLVQYFSTSEWFASVLENVGGTTHKRISRSALGNIQIQIPIDKAEQSAIGTALGDVDALLTAQDALIAKQRAIKQGAMQELLTSKRRLPGFGGKWEVKQAAQVGYFRGGTGFPLTAQGKQSGAYPFFKVSDMNNDGNENYMVNANNWISEQARKQLGATAFPAGGIVFAKVGAAVFLERKKILSMPSCIDNNMAAFILDGKKVDVSFIHYQLLSVKFGELVVTTALPALNGKVLGEIPLALPPTKEEQTAIAAVLSDIDAQIAALEAKREKTALIKQGMMQELLTGRTRLI